MPRISSDWASAGVPLTKIAPMLTISSLLRPAPISSPPEYARRTAGYRPDPMRRAEARAHQGKPVTEGRLSPSPRHSGCAELAVKSHDQFFDYEHGHDDDDQGHEPV